MKRKIWGAIIIIAGLLIIAAIIYFFFFYKPAAPSPAVIEPGTQTSEPVAGQISNGNTAKLEPVSPLKKADVTQDDLARMAAAFAERFGSFSNQSDYGNVRDLTIFMTDAMKVWADNYISDARAKKTDSSIYYGITTKSILAETKQFDSSAGQAEILVKTQRRESVGVSGNSQAFYQDIIIKYRLEGGVWRVDAADWQGK